MYHEFLDRLSRIPFHGIGLSVDVYSPNLFELCNKLEETRLDYGYLEIFQSPTSVLRQVASRLSPTFLEYHADGLWVTQPRMSDISPTEQELKRTAQHLTALQSTWITQECASKQIGGYTFGTYLPPLFTTLNASVIANNVKIVQQQIDDLCQTSSAYGPLFLLETPPLTYFAFGDLAYPDFFRAIVDTTPCGLVLDIGHLWTVFRYTAQQDTASSFSLAQQFWDAFPLERVVQIHLAGLGRHPMDTHRTDTHLPHWIDAHDQPIPDILWKLLEQILAHPRLSNLKGIAMEVDTKPVDVIVEEFRQFHNQCGQWHSMSKERPIPPFPESVCASPAMSATTSPQSDPNQKLGEEYEWYVQALITTQPPKLPFLGSPSTDAAQHLQFYRDNYLPYEILQWGGDLQEMFPRTITQLRTRNVSLETFLTFWFREPRPLTEPYDFFLIKLSRFAQFVGEYCPSAQEEAEREAHILQEAYLMATETEPLMAQ